MGDLREKAAIWLALALLGVSLFLPVGYGAEIFGVIDGWMLIYPLFPFCFLYLLPVLGLLVAKRYRVGGAVLSGLGLACWIFLVVMSKGFVIDAFLSNRTIIASGLIAGLLASGILTFVLARQAFTRGATAA